MTRAVEVFAKHMRAIAVACTIGFVACSALAGFFRSLGFGTLAVALLIVSFLLGWE